MFTWLDTFLVSNFYTAALLVAGAISGKLTPLLAACFTLYLMLITFNFLRGAEANFISDLLYRLFIFVVFISIGVSYSKYINNVVPIVLGFGNELSSGITGSSTPIAGQLDAQLTLIDQWALRGTQYTTEPRLFLFPPFLAFWEALKGAILIISYLVFAVPCYLILATSKIGLFMCVAVGPLFMGAAIFPATRAYFSAWLNTVISFTLLGVLIGVFNKISNDAIGQYVVLTVSIYDVSLGDILEKSALLLLLTFLLKFVPSLASSLSAGGLNIGGVGGLGSMIKGTASNITGASRFSKALGHFAGGKGGNTPKAGGTIEGAKPKLPG